MAAAGKPVSHIELIEAVWGLEHATFETVRTCVLKIRKKIEDDPGNPEYLLTEPNIGYRFAEERPKGDVVDSDSSFETPEKPN
jgi:two-component system, OmpR family, KDP operon response regulator KdpE